MPLQKARLSTGARGQVHAATAVFALEIPRTVEGCSWSIVSIIFLGPIPGLLPSLSISFPQFKMFAGSVTSSCIIATLPRVF